MDELALPVAGLISDDTPANTAATIRRLMALAYERFGVTKESDAFMTLSFLALPVFPHLKLTTLGLFDVDSFNNISRNSPSNAKRWVGMDSEPSYSSAIFDLRYISL